MFGTTPRLPRLAVLNETHSTCHCLFKKAIESAQPFTGCSYYPRLTFVFILQHD